MSRSKMVAAVAKAGGFGFLGVVREPAMLIRFEAVPLHARDVRRSPISQRCSRRMKAISSLSRPNCQIRYRSAS